MTRLRQATLSGCNVNVVRISAGCQSGIVPMVEGSGGDCCRMSEWNGPFFVVLMWWGLQQDVTMEWPIFVVLMWWGLQQDVTMEWPIFCGVDVVGITAGCHNGIAHFCGGDYSRMSEWNSPFLWWGLQQDVTMEWPFCVVLMWWELQQDFVFKWSHLYGQIV